MTQVRQLRKSSPWRADFTALSPVFAPLAPVARAFSDATEFPSPEAIDAALATAAGISFVRAPPPRRGRARSADDLYDASIHARGAVPTRAGSWHDFLNALVWCLYPKSKLALHARQHALVAGGLDKATGRLPGARTREQDALALFDEGGLVVTSSEPLATGEDIERAIADGRASAVIFGHAIYESIVLGVPWPMVRAVVVSPEDPDGAIAERIADGESFADPHALPRVRVAALK